MKINLNENSYYNLKNNLIIGNLKMLPTNGNSKIIFSYGEEFYDENGKCISNSESDELDIQSINDFYRPKFDLNSFEINSLFLNRKLDLCILTNKETDENGKLIFEFSINNNIVNTNEFGWDKNSILLSEDDIILKYNPEKTNSIKEYIFLNKIINDNELLIEQLTNCNCNCNDCNVYNKKIIKNNNNIIIDKIININNIIGLTINKLNIDNFIKYDNIKFSLLSEIYFSLIDKFKLIYFESNLNVDENNILKIIYDIKLLLQFSSELIDENNNIEINGIIEFNKKLFNTLKSIGALDNENYGNNVNNNELTNDDLLLRFYEINNKFLFEKNYIINFDINSLFDKKISKESISKILDSFEKQFEYMEKNFNNKPITIITNSFLSKIGEKKFKENSYSKKDFENNSIIELNPKYLYHVLSKNGIVENIFPVKKIKLKK